jgi:uncharacterized membrane protein
MSRPLALALGLAVVFAATALILSAVLPGPHKPTDYLVMGGVATIVCLALLFFVLIVAPGRAPKSPAKPSSEPDQTSRTSTDS